MTQPNAVSVLSLLRGELVKEAVNKIPWMILIRQYKKLDASAQKRADAGISRYIGSCRKVGIYTEIDTIREIIEDARGASGATWIE
ncbi:MAG TPA: hypothetical protein VNI84_12140 [Pyrinomonadaceae bacterium]|nr:hypothetical protein [Pyrinomonadaceae bacterium]